MNIDEKEIYEILKNKENENIRLEYKAIFFENGNFSSLTDRMKKKLSKVICSFLNAKGGLLICGVEENKYHTFKGVCDVGVNEISIESWKESFFSSIYRHIKPTPKNILVRLIRYDNKNIIAIKIPEGNMKPYSCNFGAMDIYPVRRGNVTMYLEREELKNLFSIDYLKNLKIRNFKRERINLLKNGEIIGDIGDDTAMIIHIIPESGLDGYKFISLEKVIYDTRFSFFDEDLILNYKPDPQYNCDGLIKLQGEKNIQSYIQVFNSGIIEAVELRLMNFEGKNKDIYSYEKLEEMLYKKIKSYIQMLLKCDIGYPYNILVTMINCKGKRSFSDNEFYPDEGIKRNDINLIKVYIDDIRNYDNQIRPLLNNFCNVFGKKSKLMKNERY